MAFSGAASAPTADMDIDMDLDLGPEPELEHEPIQVVGVFLVFEVVIDSTDMCRVLGNNVQRRSHRRPPHR
jgi:hypothetical protein